MAGIASHGVSVVLIEALLGLFFHPLAFFVALAVLVGIKPFCLFACLLVSGVLFRPLEQGVSLRIRRVLAEASTDNLSRTPRSFCALCSSRTSGLNTLLVVLRSLPLFTCTLSECMLDGVYRECYE